MRTVEKRCDINTADFPFVKSAKPWNTSYSALASKAAKGGKRIQDLGVPGNKKHRSEKGIDKQHNIRIEKDSSLRTNQMKFLCCVYDGIR
ncbi:MAG TPA: hypothetical protein VKA92_14835, partial [Segetibacter sp.]|nr:hypothetical protein [Segetibacter sp.]